MTELEFPDGSRVVYKYGDPEDGGTVTGVNLSTDERYVEWDDDVDNGWFGAYDLKPER